MGLHVPSYLAIDLWDVDFRLEALSYMEEAASGVVAKTGPYSEELYGVLFSFPSWWPIVNNVAYFLS